MKFQTVKYIKLWIAIPLAIILLGSGLIAIRGFNLGVDFVGGSVIYANIGRDYDVNDIRNITNDLGLNADIVSAGQNGNDAIIRLKETENNQEIHDKLISGIKEKFNITEDNINIEFVGPTMGRELIKNAIISILIASGAILVYIWIRFELKSGISAVIALMHDVLVMIAVTAIIGIQINSSFIAAILTILGYSINDTIVIFDRIRENIKRMGSKAAMAEIVDKSINESIVRTLNTSITTIFAISALYILGVESIRDFTLPILVGLVSGTYSSLFIASPIWAAWDKKSKKLKAAPAK